MRLSIPAYSVKLFNVGTFPIYEGSSIEIETTQGKTYTLQIAQKRG